MTSILREFNCQFVRGSGQLFHGDDLQNPHLNKWIFLHGLMGFGSNFRSIAQGLPSSCLSLLFDQRGHGKALKPRSGYTPYDYAQDLEMIRKELKWQKFFLVGHSMGGRNAMAYAHKHPDHCIHLIIEDIGPEAKPDAVRHYQMLLDSIPTPFHSKQIAKDWLSTQFLKTPFGQKGGLTLALYLYTNLQEGSDGLVDWRFNKNAILETIRLGRGQDFWNEWQHIQVPITVIRGASSSDLEPATFFKMLELNPMAKGVTIEHAGHWIHYDQPQQFIQVLRSLIDKDIKPS